VRANDLSAVERGDTVYYIGIPGSPRREQVQAAGHKWLTVAGMRFLRETGLHVTGTQDFRIESVEGFAERQERESLTAVLRPWGFNPSRARNDMSVQQMRELAALLQRFGSEGSE
jgi:hypothetical protein